MAAVASLIVPNTCLKRGEHDYAHGSLPSSEGMKQPVGEPDS
jgi:hypothetical protein